MKQSKLEKDTALIPWIIADQVVREAQAYINIDEAQANLYVLSLSDRAEEVYKHNKEMAKKWKSSGNAGRDSVYAFMRHWLSGAVKENSEKDFKKLPRAFHNGVN